MWQEAPLSLIGIIPFSRWRVLQCVRMFKRSIDEVAPQLASFTLHQYPDAVREQLEDAGER